MRKCNICITFSVHNCIVHLIQGARIRGPRTTDDHPVSMNSKKLQQFLTSNLLSPGRYPVTEHVALRLAAFQAAIELEGQSACDVLADKAGHYLPHRHIKNGFFGQRIEKKLVQEYKDLLMCRCTDKHSLMRDYLDVCRKLVFYGSAFFVGSLDSFFGSRDVTVAINRRGLHILSKDGRLEGSYLFSINQYPPLFNWDYGRPVQDGLEPCLYVSDGYLNSHQIFSKQSFLMDKILMMLQPSKL